MREKENERENVRETDSERAEKVSLQIKQS